MVYSYNKYINFNILSNYYFKNRLKFQRLTSAWMYLEIIQVKVIENGQCSILAVYNIS